MNNNPRFYLWLALAVVLWLNYTTWQHDYPPHPVVQTTASGETAPAKQPSSLANSIPQAQQSGTASSTPPAATPAPPPPPPPPTSAAAGIPAVKPAAPANAPLIHVRTDVYDI